jgi:hypothetical protein
MKSALRCGKILIKVTFFEAGIRRALPKKGEAVVTGPRMMGTWTMVIGRDQKKETRSLSTPMKERSSFQ